MIIGVLKEVKNNENRVGLTPSGASELVKKGHKVIVQKNAGLAVGFFDDQYKKNGVAIIENPIEIAKQSDIIVKVKEPIPSEYTVLDNMKGKTLFTYLHLAAAEKALTENLLKNQITSIAYETVEDFKGSLPLLKPMSQIAGVLAIQYGAQYLQKKYCGIGITLGEIDNAPLAQVVVVGGGVVGATSARTAAGMGAKVSLLELRQDRLQALKKTYDKYPNMEIIESTRDNLKKAVSKADLLIGAVLVTGAKAPIVIDRELFDSMKSGSVIVDVAIDQGGCTCISKPTTHSDPIYVIDNKVCCCITNMPGQAALQSTQALTNATLPYLLKMAGDGVENLLKADSNFAKGLNTYQGKIKCKAVAEALKMIDYL